MKDKALEILRQYIVWYYVTPATRYATTKDMKLEMDTAFDVLCWLDLVTEDEYKALKKQVRKDNRLELQRLR